MDQPVTAPAAAALPVDEARLDAWERRSDIPRPCSPPSSAPRSRHRRRRTAVLAELRTLRTRVEELETTAPPQRLPGT